MPSRAIRRRTWLRAKANYAKLDRACIAGADSIEQHRGAGEACRRSRPAGRQEVEVAYARGGKVYTARAKHCDSGLLEPDDSVSLRRIAGKTEAGAGLRAQRFRCSIPMCCCAIGLRFRSWKRMPSTPPAVTTPTLTWTCRSASENTAVRAPRGAGRRAHEQVCLARRAGRRASSTVIGRMELYNTTFETIERKIREQLARTLGPGGLRSRPRHRCDHREPLASRLRLRIQQAMG